MLGRARMRAKVAIAYALCAPPLGACVRTLWPGGIQRNGCHYRLRHPAVVARMAAALFWGLYERSEITLALFYVLGSVVFSIVGLFAGLALVRHLT